MEHIVQFAIGIDDQKIIDLIERKAEKEIMGALFNKAADIVFERNRYASQPNYDRLSDWTVSRLIDWMDAHQEEIIERTATVLAEKLSRKKMAKSLIDSKEASS